MSGISKVITNHADMSTFTLSIPFDAAAKFLNRYNPAVSSV